MNCTKCGKQLNERVEDVWNFVTGWEKKREGGGTNYIALRTPQDEYMCAVCMRLMQDGLDPGQGSLL